MKTRAGTVFLFLIFALCAVWLALVTSIFWHMDPKFGGPYRWSTFLRWEYWLVATLPPIQMLALIFAFRYRWRRMHSGDEAYMYLYTLAGPAVCAFVTCTLLVLTTGNNIQLAYTGWIYALPASIGSQIYTLGRWLVIPLVPVYFPPLAFVALVPLFWPIPLRVWMTASIVILVVFFAGGAIAEWQTETVLMTFGDKIGRVREKPLWFDPFFSVVQLSSAILFGLACAQMAFHLIIWPFFSISGQRPEY